MHYYQYLHDPSWVIESEEPRPDLLEWAYWTEIPAPAQKAEANPKPTSETETSTEETPEPGEAARVVEEKPKPARKPRTPRTPKVAESE